MKTSCAVTVQNADGSFIFQRCLDCSPGEEEEGERASTWEHSQRDPPDLQPRPRPTLRAISSNFLFFFLYISAISQ